MHFRIQKSIAAIHTKMYRACPQKRSRLSNFQPNGTIRESRCYTFVGSKRNLTPSHDERFPWGMSETSIVRWVLGICCLFLLFPGTKSSHSILILIFEDRTSIPILYKSIHHNFMIQRPWVECQNSLANYKM